MKNTQKDKKYTLIVKYKAGFLEISGDTYPIKEKLKELGMKWNPTKKLWYIKTRSDDEDYVDEYIEELSKIANIKFAEDSSIKSISKEEESVMAKEEHKKEEKTEDELDKLFSCRANLSFITIKNPSDEIMKQVKEWSKVESKYFEVYQRIGDASYQAIFDSVKNTLYLTRDDSYEPGMDYVHDPKVIEFLHGLEKEDLGKEEASKKLEDFIQKNYINVEVAKEMFARLRERKEKIKEQISIMPSQERVRQLKELFENLSDGEAYLLPEFDAERKDDSKKIVEKAEKAECEKRSYKGAFLVKCNSKYILYVRVLNVNSFTLNHEIFMLRDDSFSIEKFLQSLEEKPLSLIPDEIEKYLRENFNYKEFSYKAEPYIKAELLYFDDEHIEAVLVDGYTAMIEDILKPFGFRKDKSLGESVLIKNVKSEAEAKKIIEELKKKIPSEIRFIS